MKAWDIFVDNFVKKHGYEVVFDGLLATVEIAVVGLCIGIIIGTLLAVAKVIPKYKLFPRILSVIADAYVGLFRGTPMVVQLLIGYYVLLPVLGIILDGVVVAIIIFGMNSGAYVCEIMRGGINSVDRGQLEAGRALGLSYGRSMLKIVIPQAVKNILPTLGNEFIALIKETSVVSFIAVTDLTKAFRQLGDATYEYVIPYVMLALCYLVLVMIITALVKLIERRMSKSDRKG